MKNMLRVGLAAVAVSGLVLSTVSAQAGGRPDDKSASAEVKGVGPGAMKAAKRAAIAEWKREVAKDGNVPDWRMATEKKVKCETERDETECEVEARPIQ
jgi:hypothetical protein